MQRCLKCPPHLEDGDVVVYLGLVVLRDTLGDPDYVATLLLLQLQERVEDPEVELLHERVHVKLHLVLKELVLEGLFPDVGPSPLKAVFVLAVVLCHLANLLRYVYVNK